MTSNKNFYRLHLGRPAREGYVRKLEPWEYQMPAWLVVYIMAFFFLGFIYTALEM